MISHEEDVFFPGIQVFDGVLFDAFPFCGPVLGGLEVGPVEGEERGRRMDH